MNQQPASGYHYGDLEMASVFETIQGEGPFMGMPALFIRLSGCTLQCRWCDTDYRHLSTMTVDECFQQVRVSNKSLVVVTGGEPYRQAQVLLLIHKILAETDKTVQVETSGSAWPFFTRDAEKIEVLNQFMSSGNWGALLDELHKRWINVCSPKTSQIRMPRDLVTYWKYVLEAGGVGEDGLPVRSPLNGRILTLAQPPSHLKHSAIYISPCWNDDVREYQDNVDATLKSVMQHGFRLNVQVHKWVGIP